MDEINWTTVLISACSAVITGAMSAGVVLTKLAWHKEKLDGHDRDVQKLHERIDEIYDVPLHKLSGKVHGVDMRVVAIETRLEMRAHPHHERER